MKKRWLLAFLKMQKKTLNEFEKKKLNQREVENIFVGDLIFLLSFLF